MARPKKEVIDTEEFKYGQYNVSKPSNKYVVRLGADVVYTADTKDQVDKYLSLVGPKK